jgi:hypothetical protein
MATQKDKVLKEVETMFTYSIPISTSPGTQCRRHLSAREDGATCNQEKGGRNSQVLRLGANCPGSSLDLHLSAGTHQRLRNIFQMAFNWLQEKGDTAKKGFQDPMSRP